MSQILFFSLQSAIQVDFFYFGLSIYHAQTIQDKEPRIEILPLSSVKQMNGSTKGLIELIEKEMMTFNTCKLGNKQKYNPNGEFMKLPVEGHVYVYSHGDHSSCSSIHFSTLVECGLKFTLEDATTIPICTTPSDHIWLTPFFYNNAYTLTKYKQLAMKELETDVNLLEKIVHNNKDDADTPFRTPGPKSYNFEENDWTKRLVPGIRKMLPKSVVTYTAEMGGSFGDLLRILRHPRNLAYANFFLFRGAPDITINKNCGLFHSFSSDSVSPTISSEDECDSIEMTHQRPPMTSHKKIPYYPPEKVGELFAGLHILLVSRVLSRLSKAENINKEYVVHGLLIDKMVGVMVCHLNIHIQPNCLCQFSFKLFDHEIGILSDSILCPHIMSLAASSHTSTN